MGTERMEQLFIFSTFMVNKVDHNNPQKDAEVS